jgi:PAS domain S-box-containing protein
VKARSDRAGTPAPAPDPHPPRGARSGERLHGLIEDDLLRAALNASTHALSIVDMRAPGAPVLYVNPAFSALTGYAADEVLGRDYRMLEAAGTDLQAQAAIQSALEQQRAATVVLRAERKDGSRYWCELELAPMFNASGALTHYIASQRDATARLAREAAARDAAERDAVRDRGRELIEDRVGLALARRHLTGEKLAVIAIRVSVAGADAAKGAVDGAVHGAIDGSVDGAADAANCDALAHELSARIATVLPPNASAARLGPLQFAVVINPLETPEHAAASASGLQAELSLPIDLDGKQIMPSVQVGIAVCSEDGDTPEALLRAAEEAAGFAETPSSSARSTADDGRAVRFHSAVLDVKLAQRTALERELLAAIDGNQFHLMYQPQVSIETSTICGFEALLRWNHPTRGAIAPSEYIETAETSGLIVPIGEWVLRSAWQQLEAWERAGYTGLRMSVNVSPMQLKSSSFDSTLRRIVGGSSVPAAQLELELTERVLADAAPETRAHLDAIKALGAGIAIDDFGTGYSNLSYLSRLPVDCIKIDISFTRNVTHSAPDAAICRTICELARSLNLRVVAEGVETEGQLEFYSRLYCQEAQGYLLARPLTVEQADAMLANNVRLGVRAQRPAHERHLLVLDDEPNILASLRRLFRRDGYHVHSANNADEAFELLARHPVGVVISDQRMPQMSGTEFLRRVKGLYPHTIRIVLSGYTELQAITDAINEGAIFKFLTKPWNDDQLREQINGAFEQFEMASEKEHLQRELVNTNARLQELLGDQQRQLQRESTVLDVAHEALSAVPIPIVGFDASGFIAVSNPAADRVFGGGITLLGEPVHEVLPRAALDAAAAHALGGATRGATTRDGTTPDGTTPKGTTPDGAAPDSAQHNGAQHDGAGAIVITHGAQRFQLRVARLGEGAAREATLVTFLPIEPSQDSQPGLSA